MSEFATTDPPPLEERLSDFPAAVSPMLVKELRQGMRTNLFVIAFILLQTFMMLCLLAGLANPGSNDANGFFWFFIIATMLVIQPLRGFSALSSEYLLNTMDLIQLTRLDGWRITLGKWTALNAQGLLFITGVLPYLVIRYFLGNVNVVHDLAGIAAVALGSALATAVTIGCSVFRNIVLRGVVLVILAALAIVAYNLVRFSIFGRYGGPSNYRFGALIAFASLYGVFFFLSFGASRISPLSENQASRKRLVALLFATLCQFFYFFDLDAEVAGVTAVILGFACVDALTEPLPIFTRVLAPFRGNPVGRLSSLFLCPGWMGGLGFFVVATAFSWASFILCTAITGEILLDQSEDIITFVSTCNLIVFPLLIIHLFFPRHGSHHFTFGLYTFIQAGLFFATLMIAAIAEALDRWEDIVYLLVPIPSVLITAAAQTRIDSITHLFIAVSTYLLCIGFPLLRNLSGVREYLSALKKTN